MIFWGDQKAEEMTLRDGWNKNNNPVFQEGSHKGEKQVDFKTHFIGFKVFLDHVVFFCFSIKGDGWVGPDPW